MPRSDLKVLGRCNKFYPGTRISYCHDGTEWTGRIPKSVNEVIEVSNYDIFGFFVRFTIFCSFFLICKCVLRYIFSLFKCSRKIVTMLLLYSKQLKIETRPEISKKKFQRILRTANFDV